MKYLYGMGSKKLSKHTNTHTAKKGGGATMRVEGALCIKLNNTHAGTACGLCGGRFDPDVGPEMFIEGTWKLVCHECAGRLNPPLRKMLDYLQAVTWEQDGTHRAGDLWLWRTDAAPTDSTSETPF